MNFALPSPSPYNSATHPAHNQRTGQIPYNPDTQFIALGSPTALATTTSNPTRDPRPRIAYMRNSPTPSQRLPSPPVSPRWDSLPQNAVYNRTSTSPPASPVALAFTTARSYSTNESHRSIDSVTDMRDELPPVRSHTTEPPMIVENFSRPRVLGIGQSYYDASRVRSPNHPQPDPSRHGAASPWRQSPDPSVISNQSGPTFPSTSTHSRDNPRGRVPQPPPLSIRTPRYYVRAESSGPSFTRDPIRRMASLPNDELRSSGRSQFVAGPIPPQASFAFDNSSIATKSGSIASVYGNVDDNFSIDDVLGLYGKGFDDDSAPEDNESYDSRPATALSDIGKAETVGLDGVAEAAAAEPEPDFSLTNHSAVRESDHFFNVADGVPIHSESAIDTKHNGGPAISEGVQSHPSGDFNPSPISRHETTLTTSREDERDRYGFKKSNQYITTEEYDEWNSQYSKYLARRRKKWVLFLKENGLMTDSPNRFPPRSAKAKRFVRKGIPPDWRGAAWFYYAGGPAIVAKHAGLYEELLGGEVKEVDSEAIERDLHRTFPDNIRFRSSAGPNVETQATTSTRSSHQTSMGAGENAATPGETAMISSLRRVLHAFSIYNPRIGYCQSLNFLAGLLLLFVESEEQAFWLLNIITRVYLPGTHEMSLEGANVDLGVLMSALRDTMPNVWSKIGGELDGTDAVRPKGRRQRQRADLSTRLPPITLCMTAWFMSCFIGTLPIESTLRVWDVFFYEGSKTLFRIALTIFKLGESEIKTVGDPMEIFQVVQTIPRKMIDANGLIEACYKRRNGFGHLSQETIELKRQERRRHVKEENARMAAGEPGTPPDSEVRRKGTLFNRMLRD
ncbi:RabGAP/TBC [Xylaria sp. CBS 124048]|nr:RabGAP/TBC [Xylaria sp. CBS 124048]